MATDYSQLRDLLGDKDAALGDLEGRLDLCEQEYADLQANLCR